MALLNSLDFSDFHQHPRISDGQPGGIPVSEMEGGGLWVDLWRGLWVECCRW